VTVAWRTDIPATTGIRYGLSPELVGDFFDPTMTVQHAITLVGLVPNTTYFYQVLSNGRALMPPTTFTTSKSPDQQSFAFAVFGDSGAGTSFQFAIASLLQAANPEFLIHTGGRGVSPH